MSAPKITVALSSHRVETLTFAERLLRGHDLVLLEEPPDELFGAMLSAAIGIDAYVDELSESTCDTGIRLTLGTKRRYRS